jgi:uncharacterized membrane protein YhaH (DUF805 family)
MIQIAMLLLSTVYNMFASSVISSTIVFCSTVTVVYLYYPPGRLLARVLHDLHSLLLLSVLLLIAYFLRPVTSLLCHILTSCI